MHPARRHRRLLPVYIAAFIVSGGALLGPVILGRSAPWLLLQLLAVTTVAGAAITGPTWWRARNRFRLALLAAGTATFLPWALYWGLLLP